MPILSPELINALERYISISFVLPAATTILKLYCSVGSIDKNEIFSSNTGRIINAVVPKIFV